MDRKEAIKVVMENYPHVGFSGSQFETALRTLIPELTEGEDERLRKKIIKKMKTLQTPTNILTNNFFSDEEIAYLDKQKEQKPWKVGENAYFTPEQKPVDWSEEDENCRIDILYYLEDAKKYYPQARKLDRCIKWFKSLRPQPLMKRDFTTPHQEFFKWIYDRLINIHKENRNVDYMISFKQRIEELSFDNPSWKPSEEQMEALKCAIEDIAKFSKRGGRQVELENEPYYSALHSLYCNLEKLM